MFLKFFKKLQSSKIISFSEIIYNFNLQNIRFSYLSDEEIKYIGKIWNKTNYREDRYALSHILDVRWDYPYKWHDHKKIQERLRRLQTLTKNLYVKAYPLGDQFTISIDEDDLELLWNNMNPKNRTEFAKILNISLPTADILWDDLMGSKTEIESRLYNFKVITFSILKDIKIQELKLKGKNIPSILKKYGDISLETQEKIDSSTKDAITFINKFKKNLLFYLNQIPDKTYNSFYLRDKSIILQRIKTLTENIVRKTQLIAKLTHLDNDLYYPYIFSLKDEINAVGNKINKYICYFQIDIGNAKNLDKILLYLKKLKQKEFTFTLTSTNELYICGYDKKILNGGIYYFNIIIPSSKYHLWHNKHKRYKINLKNLRKSIGMSKIYYKYNFSLLSTFAHMRLLKKGTTNDPYFLKKLFPFPSEIPFNLRSAIKEKGTPDFIFEMNSSDLKSLLNFRKKDITEDSLFKIKFENGQCVIYLLSKDYSAYLMNQSYESESFSKKRDLRKLILNLKKGDGTLTTYHYTLQLYHIKTLMKMIDEEKKIFWEVWIYSMGGVSKLNFGLKLNETIKSDFYFIFSPLNINEDINEEEMEEF